MELPEEYVGREHTWLKHRVLFEYLTARAHKQGSLSRSRRVKLWYVDCFAGPWKAADTELRDTSIAIGLKALETAAATWRERGFAIDVAAVFVKKDPSAFAERQNCLNARESVVETHPIHGKFGDSVEGIERLIGSDAAFIIVDPTGWKGVGMRYIAPLLRKPRRDEERTKQLALFQRSSPETDGRYEMQRSKGMEEAEAEVLRLLELRESVSFGELWPEILQSCHITETNLKKVVTRMEKSGALVVENWGKGERSVKESHRLSVGTPR